MSNAKRHQFWCKTNNETVKIESNNDLSGYLVKLLKQRYPENACKLIARDLDVSYYLVRNWLQRGINLDAYHLLILLKRYDFVRKEFGFYVAKNRLPAVVKESVEETSEKIFDLIAKSPIITSQELQKNLVLSRRQVEYALNKLKNDGRIIRKGSTKRGEWVIV